MKTFIVLIPLEYNRDARRQCESIESYKFNIGGAVQATAIDVKANVINLIEDTFEKTAGQFLTNIEVEPITDFMDRVNNEEFNPDLYFMSYVRA
jgi:hypothetical protein